MKGKLKLLLIVPVATGVVVFSNATRSDAFVLDTLKGLWNKTTSIVTDTLDQYVGQYVTDLAGYYVPKGLESIAGALGLPDPGEMFKDIREEAGQNKTEDNDIAAGGIEETEVAAGSGQAMGEAVLSADGQEAQKQTSEAAANISKSSSEVAEECQSSNISQEVMKCLVIQNANTAKLSQVQISQQQQVLQQIAAGNIAQAKELEQSNQEARAKEAEINQSAKDAETQAEVVNGLTESLANQ